MNQTSNIERARTCKDCFYFADSYEGGGRCMALPQPSRTSEGRTECSLFRENTYSGAYKKTSHTMLSQGGGSGLAVMKPMKPRARPAMDLSGGRPEMKEMECECGSTVSSTGTDFECKKCGRKWEVVAK